MSYKKIPMLFLLFVLFCFNNAASASKLPNDVWNYVKSNLPEAQQRFDSVVTLKNDVMYIPLTPPSVTSVESIQVEYTYPEKQTFKNYPEVVLLNNGYSFLKVVKDTDGNYTLTKKDDLPLKVRLGIMPQDMLTPIGLKMPESLKLTLGDILIPTKEEKALAYRDSSSPKEKNPYAPTVAHNEFIQTAEFKNKKILINPKNSKFFEVYNETSKKPLYELKLSSMPLKVLVSEKSNVALVLYWSGKEVEIIDLKDENSISKIELDSNATDVVLNQKDNIAYVTSQNAGKIYCIDLNSMQLTKVIRLDQRPSKVSYSEIDDSISFYDEFSSKVYNVTKNKDDFIVQPMGNVNNLSKILSDVANIYAISRTDNQLYVFDKGQSKLINTVELDKKPTDAVLYQTKLFIICSKEGYINVYDTIENKIVSREQVAKEGFYSKLTLIPNEKNILITGINSKNYLIYDIDKMKLSKTQTSYIDISNIIILDKNQRL